MRTDSEVKDLAKVKPVRASWNAYNYDKFAGR